MRKKAEAEAWPLAGVQEPADVLAVLAVPQRLDVAKGWKRRLAVGNTHNRK